MLRSATVADAFLYIQQISVYKNAVNDAAAAAADDDDDDER